MPKKVTVEQRQAVLRLLAQGQDRDTIAAAVGVTPGQVSAVAAHVKMGTYALPEPAALPEPEELTPETAPPAVERTTNLLRQLRQLEGARGRDAQINPILLGVDAESGEEVFFNPDPASGAPNPHVLILGESGTGKTYAISCLTAELAQEGIVSIVFDYGQGFSLKTLPPEFVTATNPVELHVGRDGVDINPLQLFPSDLHGPVNVAQRVADTFARVYKKIGVQQHAVLRQAVLDVMADAGIRPDAPTAWSADLPAFGSIQDQDRHRVREPRRHRRAIFPRMIRPAPPYRRKIQGSRFLLAKPRLSLVS
jgi:Helicase HerA, central domain